MEPTLQTLVELVDQLTKLGKLQVALVETNDDHSTVKHYEVQDDANTGVMLITLAGMPDDDEEGIDKAATSTL